MDNACREYLFIADFFSLTSTAAQEMFDSIFTKTQAHILVSWNVMESDTVVMCVLY